MAITRMTREAIAASISQAEREEFVRRYDATTEEDISRMMIEDGEDPDAELRDEDIISPWYIRKRLGMTQEVFAATLGIPVGTLRNWEQNRVGLEPAVLALMRILAREPVAALRALGRAAA